MKKRIIFSSIFLIIFLLIGLIKKNNQSLFFSDYLLVPLNNEKIKSNYSFSNENLTSDLLLEYLDYNAKNLKNSQKINNLIKTSKEIFISVGINDLMEYVSLVDKKLIYNPSIINEKIALLEYNIHEIITSILAIKEIDIYCFSIYYFNDQEFDLLIEDYNSDLKNILECLNCNYIETNELISIDDYTYSKEDQKIIYDYIKNIN